MLRPFVVGCLAKKFRTIAVQLKPYLPDVMRHMGIALHDFAEMVAVVCDDAAGSRSIEVKEPAPDHNSLGESSPPGNDRSKVLMKDAVHMSSRELTKFGKSSVSTVRSCQQATEHTVNLPGGNSRKELGDSSAADYQGLNSEFMKIKPSPLIQKPDHAGKVFLTSRRDHAKEVLSSSKNPALSSKAEREGKRHKKKYTPRKKEASKMAQDVEELGDNLVGSRIKVWCPMDQMLYEGIIASFDHSTMKHEVRYTDGNEESLHLKEAQWELVEALGALPDSGERATPVASPRFQADSGSQTSRDLQVKVALPNNNVPPLQSEILDVQGCKTKASTAPILESIFAKHGDIAAQCAFKTAAVRATFLEVVCDVVRRLQTNDVAAIISEMETIEMEVSEAEAANIKVSWLRPYLEAFRGRKEAGQRSRLLMDTKKNTMLVNKAVRRDLRERDAELVAAQERVKEAERHVELLDLVEKKLDHDILESRTEEDSWRRPAIL